MQGLPNRVAENSPRRLKIQLTSTRTISMFIFVTAAQY